MSADEDNKTLRFTVAESLGIINQLPSFLSCESVWPSGKALGVEAEGPRFDSLRFSFLFSSKIVVYGHCLVTLPTQLMKH